MKTCFVVRYCGVDDIKFTDNKIDAKHLVIEKQQGWPNYLKRAMENNDTNLIAVSLKILPDNLYEQLTKNSKTKALLEEKLEKNNQLVVFVKKSEFDQVYCPLWNDDRWRYLSEMSTDKTKDLYEKSRLKSSQKFTAQQIRKISQYTEKHKLNQKDCSMNLQDFQVIDAAPVLAATLPNTIKHYTIHTPVPTLKFFKKIAFWQLMVANFMLMDIINVHSPDYKRNLNKIFASPEGKNIQETLGIKTLPKIVVNPIGLSFEKYHRLGDPDKALQELKNAKPESKEALTALLNKAVDTTTNPTKTKLLPILSTGRGDPTKGFPLLVKLFEELLKEHTNYFQENGITLVIQMAPNRTDIKEYRTVQYGVCKKTKELNEEHQTKDYRPCYTIYDFAKMETNLTLFQLCKIAVYMSVCKDGFHLSSGENKSAQIDGEMTFQGRPIKVDTIHELLLSTLTGCANSYPDFGKQCNPNDREIYKALLWKTIKSMVETMKNEDQTEAINYTKKQQNLIRTKMTIKNFVDGITKPITKLQQQYEDDKVPQKFHSTEYKNNLLKNYKKLQKTTYVERNNAKITIYDSKLSLEQFINQFVIAIKDGKGRFLLDIDGTLSHFHSDKMKAFVLSKITRFIDAMETKYPGSIILITGRPKKEVERLFKLPNGDFLFIKKPELLNVIVEHGAERYERGKRVSSVKLPQQPLKTLIQYKQKAQQLVKEIIAKLGKYIQQQENYFTETGDIRITLKNSQASGILYGEKMASCGFHTRILHELLEQTQNQTQRSEIENIIIEFEQKVDVLIGELQSLDPNLDLICKSDMHSEMGFHKHISKGKAIKDFFAHNNFTENSFITLCDAVGKNGTDRTTVKSVNEDPNNTHYVFQVGDHIPAEGLKFTGRLDNPNIVGYLFKQLAKKLELNISKSQWLQHSIFGQSTKNVTQEKDTKKYTTSYTTKIAGTITKLNPQNLTSP
jgi:trehalose-6-phosphate synthase/trehalose-6-phosphatase